MSYLLIAILILVSILNIKAEYGCPNDNSLQCMCNYDETIKFQCPPIHYQIVIEALPETFINIYCYHLDTFNTDLLPNYRTDNITSIMFSSCPLPQENFQPFLNKLHIQNILTLRLEYIPISESFLSKKLFIGLSSVEKLIISDVVIKLDDDLLRSFPNLTDFYLERSIVGDLHTFKFPNKLKILRLQNISLNKVPKENLEDLSELKQLHLWGNNITVIKRTDFTGLKSLKSLELSYNQIHHIEEDSFVDLEQLELVNLSFNKLLQVNPTIFKHNVNLVGIRIEDNPGLIIPNKIFASLKKLKYVSLRSCKIEKIPEDIFENSTNIISINMQRNFIIQLPETLFKKLSNLKILDLSNNFINSLPETIFYDLKELENLTLDKNNITNINNNLFKNTVNLISLSVKNNKIVDIESKAFQRLEKLRYIDLSNNFYEMNYDLTNPFEFCKTFVIINLRNNLIRTFSVFLTYMKSLQNLDLSYNKIKLVKVNEIISASSYDLQYINLSNNEIEEVYFETVEKQMSLHVKKPTRIDINLKKNPLVCDCGIYQLVRYYQDDTMTDLKNYIKIDIDGIKCTEPQFNRTDIKHILPNDVKCNLLLKNSPSECDSYWKPHTRFWEIDCSNRNLTYFPKLSLSNENISVNLNGNYINNGLNSGLGYEHVKYLYLSNNKLTELTWIPDNIEFLTLDGNKLTHLDSKVVQELDKLKHLEKIQLSNNPWTCQCSAEKFQNFLINHNNKVNPRDVICIEDNQLLIEKKNLCKLPTSSILAILFPLLTFLVLIIIGLSLYIRYRQEVKIWLFSKNLCLWFITEEELDQDKKYDIFISYSSKDEDFVIKTLLPALETGPSPINTCIHIRDWKPGEMILTHVTRSVMNSKRTLVVLSNNFLESVWGKHEFKLAHTQAIQEGRPKVIIIKYGNLNETKLDDDLRAYLNTNTYVEWGKPWFWHKLKYALPHAQKNYLYKADKKYSSLRLIEDDKFHLTTPTLMDPQSTPPVENSNQLNHQKFNDI